MAINIPSTVFDTYNEAVLLFTRTATLVYPEKREDCPNCKLDTFGTKTRSVSVYVQGGPYPFERGMPCPYCGGKGYKGISATEDVTLRIYWNRKFWIDVGVPIDIPDGSIQTIAYMTDLPKIEKCTYLIPNYDGIQNYDKSRYQRHGPSYPQGFKQNSIKYIVTFWKRANA